MYKAHIQIKLSLPVHRYIYRAWSANTVFITIDKNMHKLSIHVYNFKGHYTTMYI